METASLLCAAYRLESCCDSDRRADVEAFIESRLTAPKKSKFRIM
jgi:hypothetical protein